MKCANAAGTTKAFATVIQKLAKTALAALPVANVIAELPEPLEK